jgi:hypothetical protein
MAVVLDSVDLMSYCEEMDTFVERIDEAYEYAEGHSMLALEATTCMVDLPVGVLEYMEVALGVSCEGTLLDVLERMRVRARY